MQLHVRFDIAAGPYVLSPKRGYVWRRWCFREKGYVSNFSYQFHDVPVTCEGVSGRREDFNVVDLHLSFRQILTLSCNRNSWTATLILLHWTNAGVWIHQQNKFHRIANDPFHECFNILFFNLWILTFKSFCTTELATDRERSEPRRDKQNTSHKKEKLLN